MLASWLRLIRKLPHSQVPVSSTGEKPRAQAIPEAFRIHKWLVSGYDPDLKAAPHSGSHHPQKLEDPPCGQELLEPTGLSSTKDSSVWPVVSGNARTMCFGHFLVLPDD